MSRVRTVLTITAFLISCLGSTSLAADITGLWKESSWPGDNWITITQDGKQTDIILIGFFNGKMEAYKGSGKINGDSIYYTTHWTKNPRQNPDNNLQITLSADANTMNGKWISTRGESGNFTFVRVK